MKKVIKKKALPVVYEVSVRNYSKEGTIQAVTDDLERIASLGIDVIWLMPIYENAKKNKKGTLGSPYAIKNHKKIDGEYGTEEDLKDLIDTAHKHKIKVIMDMVFHHSSMESELVEEHPDWYLKDSRGNPTRKFQEWSDVYDFNYSATKDLWNYNIGVMEKWIEVGIDGFRCDIVTLMPMEFWASVKEHFSKKTALIWIGEVFENSIIYNLREHGVAVSSAPEMHRVFDITYDYDGFEYLKNYFKGKIYLKDFIDYLALQDRLYPFGAVKMRFLENHDQPRFAHIMRENMEKIKNWTLFYLLLPGATLIHAGQEFGLTHHNDMFNSDPINWEKGNVDFYEFFKFNLKVIKEIKEKCTKFFISEIAFGVVKIEWHGKREIYTAILNLEERFGDIDIDFELNGFEVSTHKRKTFKDFMFLQREPILIKTEI